MKQLKLLGILLSLQLTMDGQSLQQIKTWLYGLPIDKELSELKKVISKDKRFKSFTPPDTTRLLKVKGLVIDTRPNRFTYWGKILTPNLPPEIVPDSSTIELTYGFNSGEIKILRFEHFLKDNLDLEKLFNLASDQLKKGCKNFYNAKFGMEHKSDYGIGIELIYPHDRKKLQKLSLYKKTSLAGTKSLLIEYEAAN